MLQITIPDVEQWDERKNEFVNLKGKTLQLEHSLVSLSKWESKWHKPFLADKNKTDEEMTDYVRCMTITQNVNPEIYNYLTPDNIKEINEYIENPMTATTFSDEKNGRGKREIITAEIIYYWMVALNIPPEYAKWHLNRLITLVKVCNIKNQPPKKMSRRDTAAQYAALNAANRRRFNSRG